MTFYVLRSTISLFSRVSDFSVLRRLWIRLFSITKIQSPNSYSLPLIKFSDFTHFFTTLFVIIYLFRFIIHNLFWDFKFLLKYIVKHMLFSFSSFTCFKQYWCYFYSLTRRMHLFWKREFINCFYVCYFFRVIEIWAIYEFIV